MQTARSCGDPGVQEIAERLGRPLDLVLRLSMPEGSQGERAASERALEPVQGCNVHLLWTC